MGLRCNTDLKSSSDCRMACGQSTAHARLMGAILRRRNRQSASHGPSRASRSGGFFVVRSTAHSKHPGASRNGRPGSRGSRRKGACPSARGLSEGTKAQAGYRWQSESLGVRNSARTCSRAANEFVLISGWPHRAARPTLVVKISDTSLQWKQRVRIPPVKSRTVERPRKAPARATDPVHPLGEGRELNH